MFDVHDLTVLPFLFAPLPISTPLAAGGTPAFAVPPTGGASAPMGDFSKGGKVRETQLKGHDAAILNGIQFLYLSCTISIATPA